MTYSIFEAERFESHIVRNQRVIVFYDPRFEISEETFNLTSPRLIPKEIEKEVTKLYRNYPSSILRYNAISQLILEDKYPEMTISPLKDVISHQINLPKIKIGTQVIEPSHNISIEELIESNIEYDTFIPQLQFLIDSTGSNEIPSQILEFVKYFAEITGINVSVQEFASINSVQLDSEAIVICLNDLVKGSGYIYNKLKEQLEMPNKVVRFSTILEEDWNQVTKLVWLGLRFRYSKLLYQVSETNATHQNSVAIHLSPYFGGEWMILSGTSIATNKVNSHTQVIYNDREKELIDSDSIIKFLQKLINFEKNSHFMLEFSNVQLQPVLEQLSNYDYCLVSVNPSNSIYFGEIDQESQPIDGLTTNISETTAILMTNGFPNNRFDGIPKPLLVKKIIGTHNLVNIVSDIFYQTFINPYSIAKPKLPFCLGLAIKIPSEIGLIKKGGWKN